MLPLLLSLLLLLPLLPLLSRYFATETLLQIPNISGVIELTTQLLILENFIWPPLVWNQQIWVEYSTLENCYDPTCWWAIARQFLIVEQLEATLFWLRCRGGIKSGIVARQHHFSGAVAGEG